MRKNWVATGLASRLRLKQRCRAAGQPGHQGRHGAGISLEIETMIRKEPEEMDERVATGLASRLRLKHGFKEFILAFVGGRHGAGISLEIETAIKQAVYQGDAESPR